MIRELSREIRPDLARIGIVHRYESYSLCDGDHACKFWWPSEMVGIAHHFRRRVVARPVSGEAAFLLDEHIIDPKRNGVWFVGFG